MDRVSLTLDALNRDIGIFMSVLPERVFVLACFELEHLDIPAGKQQYPPWIIHQFIRGLARGDGGRRWGSKRLSLR